MSRNTRSGSGENETRRYHAGGEPANDNNRSLRDREDEDTSVRSAMPQWLSGEDPKIVEAVTHYAQSQNVDIDDERVQKYARGLTGRTGDFGGREQESPVGQRK